MIKSYKWNLLDFEHFVITYFQAIIIFFFLTITSAYYKLFSYKIRKKIRNPDDSASISLYLWKGNYKSGIILDIKSFPVFFTRHLEETMGDLVSR